MKPAISLLLTSCALLAAGHARAAQAGYPLAGGDAAAHAEATLRRVVKLSPERQQVWLRLIEQRYDWAALITMEPDDARRERDRVAGILRQKAVAWNDMAALLRQLDQRETAAVSRMVRIYRTEVYKNFGGREKELVNRQEAWFRVWSAWEKAGSPTEQQDRLMDWLAAAIKASSKDTVGPLPADPKFGPDVELVPEALVKRLREEQDKRRVAQAAGPPGAPAERVGEGPVPLPEIPHRGLPASRIPDPAWSASRMQSPANVAFARDRATPLPAASVAPQSQLPRCPRGPEPAAGDPVALTTPPAPRRPTSGSPAAAFDIDYTASGASEGAGPMLAQSGGETAQPQALGDARPPSELPPLRATAPPAGTDPQAGAPRVTAAAVPTPAAICPAIVAAQQRAAADPVSPPMPLPRRDVLAMLPRQALQSAVAGAEDAASYTVQRRPLQPNLAPPPAGHPLAGRYPAAAQDDRHARVNIDELRTRVEGFNLGLRSLEGELNEKRDLTADQLDSLLSRLDILVLRQRDLALFRGLATPQEQAGVGQIDSPRAAVATLGTRIAELRSKVRHNESLRETDRTAAIKHLDDLSDRLATLAAEK